jgi:hypothetical protein
MATTDMQEPAQGAAPAAMPADAASTDAQPAGYCIKIDVDAEGKLSVGVETYGQEAAEQPGADVDAGAMSPASDIKDALTQALQIYKAGGKPDATAEHARQLTSQGFTAGYNED